MKRVVLRISKRLVFLIVLAAIGFLTYHSPVEAHSTLKETFPKGNEVLEKAPSNIDIWFQDPVVIHTDSIKIVDSKGRQIPTAKSKRDSKDAGHIKTKLEQELTPGNYTVMIRVIAQDGYLIEKDFSFSVKKAVQSESKELELVKSSIADGKIHKGDMKQVELWFNQAAEVTALGLFNDNYQPVRTKTPVIDPDNPRHITIPLIEELSSGSYQVTWYASPVKNNEDKIQSDQVGVFYFAVNEFTSMTPIQANENSVEWSAFTFFLGVKQIAYWLTFIGMTVLFGISWFYSIILKNRLERFEPKKIVLLFYSLSLLGIILLVIQHRWELSDLSVKDFLSLKFAWIPILQLTLITMGILIKKIRLLFFGSALILWPFIIGHASYPRYGGYITMVIMSLHILAVGIWMGGLFALMAKPKDKKSGEWFSSVGPFFSKWAMISVVLIVCSGGWMTVAFLPSFSFISLVESEWGRSLMVKMIVFLLLVFVGYVQRRTVKPLSINLAHTFFRRVKVEVIYGVIIFFFAATLVTANPSAAEQGVYKETINPQEIDMKVELTPLQMGLNTMTLNFPNNPEILDVIVELRMAPNWRIEHHAFKVDEGVYKLTGNLLHAAGTIHMQVKVLMENGEEVQIPYRIVVPGEVRFNE